MIEVIYRRRDNTYGRSIARLIYRRGSYGEWLIDDRPIEKVDGDIVYCGPPGVVADLCWSELTNGSLADPDCDAHDRR